MILKHFRMRVLTGGWCLGMAVGSVEASAQVYPGSDMMPGGIVEASGYGGPWVNPACWTVEQGPVAGLLSTRPFMMKELAVRAVGVMVPLGGGGAGLSWLGEGFSLYRRNRFSAGYGRKFGIRTSAGLRLHYCSLAMGEGYGKAAGSGADIGFRIRLGRNLHAGGVLFLPATPSVELRQAFPGYLGWALQWQPSPAFMLIPEIGQNEYGRKVVRVSMVFTGRQGWQVRAGTGLSPLYWFAAAGFRFSHWRIFAENAWHAWLGYTPCVALIYNRNRDESP